MGDFQGLGFKREVGRGLWEVSNYGEIEGVFVETFEKENIREVVINF